MRLNPEQLREKVAPLFHENFARHGELGAAVSIWQDGESVLELEGGFRDANWQQAWTPDTIVLVWSATKGVASACLLHALQENDGNILDRVERYWPEFAQNGKGQLTIAQVMSHQAGLSALDVAVSITDYAAVIAALERQRPLWAVADGHGYHARTYGFLVDELVRRVAGMSIAKYWRIHFAAPLDLDLWIGLPPDLNDRCATIYAAKSGPPPEPAEFYRQLSVPGTLQRATFTSPAGLHAVSAMNKPELRALEISSFSGIGNATALAKFYGMLANHGEIGGRRFFDAKTLAWMTTPLTEGVDRVFGIPTSFSAGFMLNSDRGIFGTCREAFGHPGAGGSNAFADPENGIGFAYVMNQMEQTLLPSRKGQRLVDAIYRIHR